MHYYKYYCPKCGELSRADIVFHSTGSIRLVGGELVDDTQEHVRCKKCSSEIRVEIPLEYAEEDPPF